MNDLPKEWEAIRKGVVKSALHPARTIVAGDLIDAVREAVERCYNLHNQPPKELTDADCMEIWERVWQGKFDSQVCQSSVEVVRNLAALIAAKQREPEVVEFRAARRKSDGTVRVIEEGDGTLAGGWQWLDHDGKPQTFKVVLS